jgi:O-antigen/teichoic acid export membrane protein
VSYEANNIAKNSLYILSSRIARIFVTIGFNIFFAHIFSIEEYAAIAVFDILLHMTNIMSSFGLETTCLRELPLLLENNERAKAAAMIKTSVCNRVFWSGVLAIIIFFNAEWLAELFFKEVHFVPIVKIMSLGVFFGSLNTSLDLLGQGTRAFKGTSIIQFANAVAYSLSGISLFLLFGYKGWIVGYTCARGLGTILYIKLMWSWLRCNSGIANWKKMVRSSAPFYARGFMLFSLNKLDLLIIGIFAGPVALGTYHVAKRLSSQIEMVYQSIGAPLIVRIAAMRGEQEELASSYLRKISRYNSFLFIPLCFVVIAFGYPLLELYGGRKYTDGYIILVILCMARMVVGVWNGVYVRGVFTLGNPRDTLLVETVGSLVNTVFLLILIRTFGVTGVPLATLFSVVSIGAVAYFVLNRRLKVAFDFNAMGKSFISAGALLSCAAVLQLICYNLYLIPLYLIVSISVFLLIWIRYLEAEDIGIIESIFPRIAKPLMRVLRVLGLSELTSDRNEE